MGDLRFAPRAQGGPPLPRPRRDGSEVVAFDVEMDPAAWVFAEHKMDGTPSMPGTGIVELIRAAYQEITGSATVEIRDLVFPSLLAARPGFEARAELRRPPDGGFTFTLLGGHPSRPAEQYARARVYPVQAADAPRHDLAALRDDSWQDTTPPFSARVGLMEFGRRWDAIRSRHSTADVDLLDLRLPDEFTADLGQFLVHPAMLDVAGAMGLRRPGDDLYLPFGYDRIVIRGPIPRICHSIIRHLDDTRGELARIDVTIVGEDGVESLAAEGYSLLRVSENRTPDAVSRLTSARRKESPGKSQAASDTVIALIRESNAE